MPEVRISGGELDGLAVHYLSEGCGPATVLIHGLGGFAESWRHTIAGLGGQSRVIALDLPGFGQSAKPRRPYRLAFLAQAVEGLLRALGIERASVVGHSLGGAVAAVFAASHPERVDRLALIGAVVPGFPVRPSFFFRTAALPGIGELLASLVTPAMCEAALERCFFAADRKEIAFFVRHGYAERSGPAARAAYLSALRAARHDFVDSAPTHRAALGRLRRPILMIHGRQDPVVPLEHAAAALAGLPQADGRWLDRCGHFPQIEHAETVNAWLRDFLPADARFSG